MRVKVVVTAYYLDAYSTGLRSLVGSVGHEARVRPTASRSSASCPGEPGRAVLVNGEAGAGGYFHRLVIEVGAWIRCGSTSRGRPVGAELLVTVVLGVAAAAAGFTLKSRPAVQEEMAGAGRSVVEL